MKIQKINPIVLLLVVVIYPALSTLMNYLFVIHFFSPVSNATNHLIQPTLLANLISLVVLSILIFGLGKLNLRSMLLNKGKLIFGLKLTFGLWLVTQLISILILFISNTEVVFVKDFNLLIGRFAGQLFGTAPKEEIMFRGLLLLQLYLIFIKKFTGKWPLVWAIVLSQLFFALIHIPNRLMVNQVGNLALDLLALFLVGIVLALIYVRTKNLVFLVGVHALINAPFSLTNTAFTPQIVVLGLAIICAVFWHKLAPQAARERLIDFV